MIHHDHDVACCIWSLLVLKRYSSTYTTYFHTIFCLSGLCNKGLLCHTVRESVTLKGGLGSVRLITSTNTFGAAHKSLDPIFQIIYIYIMLDGLKTGSALFFDPFFHAEMSNYQIEGYRGLFKLN
jgi:hypothetical protein